MNLWSLLTLKTIISKWKTILTKVLLLSLSKWIEISWIEELRHVLLLLLVWHWSHWLLILMLSSWTTSWVASWLTLAINWRHVICIFFRFFSIIWSTSFFWRFSFLFTFTLLSLTRSSLMSSLMKPWDSCIISCRIQIWITFVTQVSSSTLRHWFSFSSNNRSGCRLSKSRIINWKSFFGRSLMSSILMCFSFPYHINIISRSIISCSRCKNWRSSQTLVC